MQENSNKPAAPRGSYVDPESGQTLVALEEATADAFVKLGWRRVEEAEVVKEPSQEGPSLNELRARAKELEISGAGTKEELAARIAEAEKEEKE